jgi:Holliday junction resolvase-like predicted endonuclease
MNSTTTLTEDRVIDAVCRKLSEDGYTIIQRASAVQHGYDIVARKDGRDLIIEAKGAGSSKSGTARYGMEFNSGQVFDHVAKAVLKAMRIVSSHTARAGVALPDNQSHRREIEQVAAALRDAGVAVFWVNDRDEVRIDAPWEL